MNADGRCIADAGTVILGKETALRPGLACLLARGHLPIEDLPGVGNTTLAHLLARLLGLAYQRIQFTSDLLPADILGVAVFEREAGRFRFHPGPIFSQLVLDDEINRAPERAAGGHGGAAGDGGRRDPPAARAWAFIDGRDHVLPDDVQAVSPAVAGHRLTPVEAPDRERGSACTPAGGGHP